MLQAVLWGLVQGLTEFLPVSSSGHLVLVPAALGVDPPDLATTAVLHLGTLLAVLAYYRRDVVAMVRFDEHARRLWWLIILGTVPALIGLVVEKQLEVIQESVHLVAGALLVTGVVLLVSTRVAERTRVLEDGTWIDALGIGIAQAFALIPGISRSGMTITTGLARGFDREQAARYSFLLAVPAIAGGGLLELLKLSSAGGFGSTVWVAMAVAAVSGYLAIAGLIKILVRRGLFPFAIYCFVVGAAALILL